MIAQQLNTLCASYQNVDGMSIHSASGIDTADIIGVKQSLTWGTPMGGMMTATATFEGVSGPLRYVRVWDGAVFIEEFAVAAGEGVEVVSQDVTIAIQHRARG